MSEVLHSSAASYDAIATAVIAMIIAQKQLPGESITVESTFDELQMDSLDKINLSFEVEERFKISIPDNALNALRTVGDVVVGVQRLQAEQQ